MSAGRRETEVELYLSRSSSVDAQWSLRVVDARNHLEILRVVMDNDTFSDMMASTGAGNLGFADVLVSDYVGKYKEVRILDVPTNGLYGDELTTELGKAARRLLTTDPVMADEHGWMYDGYSGGAGGSQVRSLRFTRFVDEKPDSIRR